jgi:aminopeptidase N
MYDKQKALDYINAKKKHIGNKGSIVGVYNVNEEGSGDMYSKGMLFLNTLRHVVNDDKMWWSLIKGLCDTTFKIKNTNYAEVVNYFNTKSGKNLSLLFEQYLKHAELPVLEYKLKKAKHGEFEITYRWNSSIKNFNMPFYVSTKEQKNIRLNGSSVFESAKIKMKKDTELKIDNELMYFESKRILR